MNKLMEMVSTNINKKSTIGDKYIEKYPGNIPVIVHFDGIVFSPTETFNAKTRTSQLLVPNDTTLGYLIIIIRRSAKIPYGDKITLTINDSVIMDTESVNDAYIKNKNINDGCLHVTARKENITL